MRNRVNLVQFSDVLLQTVHPFFVIRQHLFRVLVILEQFLLDVFAGTIAFFNVVFKRFTFFFQSVDIAKKKKIVKILKRRIDRFQNKNTQIDDLATSFRLARIC